jgi:hypothetical protein
MISLRLDGYLAQNSLTRKSRMDRIFPNIDKMLHFRDNSPVYNVLSGLKPSTTPTVAPTTHQPISR